MKEGSYTITAYTVLGNEYTIAKPKIMYKENIPFSSNNQSIRYNYKIADSDKCKILKYHSIYITVYKSWRVNNFKILLHWHCMQKEVTLTQVTDESNSLCELKLFFYTLIY